MGSPPGIESLQMSLRGVAALMPKVCTIRMLGSAALMLAWVAYGQCVAIAYYFCCDKYIGGTQHFLFPP
jgi:myo-inositol-1(or 4)-monophosphatase